MNGVPDIPLLGCRCETCVPMGNPFDGTAHNVRMILCPNCGNKRCPKATNHRNPCTNSNAPGQRGSSWEHVQPAAERVVVTICPTSVWVESGMFGERYVVVQHEGMEPFDYAVFNYRYGYTDNASTHSAATALALQLGAVEPVETRVRPFVIPTIADMRRQIEQLQATIKHHEDHKLP